MRLGAIANPRLYALHIVVTRRHGGRRQDRLQWVATTWDPLPFDAEAARAYGRVFAAVRVRGRAPRSRLADFLIASTAVANGLPLYTRNPGDFIGLEDVVTVVVV